MSSLPRLHILTDTRIQSRYSHQQLAIAAWQAGEIAVQYRNKDYLPERDELELSSMAEWARLNRKVLIVNDRADLARRVGAAGVHLGQEDASVNEARRVMGDESIVGATVHSKAEQDGLRNSFADYHGVGPVFGTSSKNLQLPPLGLDGLRQLVETSPVPVIAIGNIQLKDIPAVMKTGVHGIAVISAYCMADDLSRAAKSLLEAVYSHA